MDQWINLHGHFGVVLHNVIRQRRQHLRYRHIRDHQNPFQLPNERFIKLFRLNKDLARGIIAEIGEFVDPATRRDTVPLHLQVLIALNFYGHGSFQTVVGRDLSLAVSQPVVSRIINKISRIFAEHLLPRYVKFPTTQEEIRNTTEGFSHQFNIPNTLGAIDCTHVAISTPKIDDPVMPAIAYYNRKGFYSINMQGICNSNLIFTNVNARFPGATHDSAIWETSTINAYLRRAYNRGPMRNKFLIGDSGYPLQPWLMTPIPDAPPNTPEAHYTHVHCSARNVIERCFGVLKQRFRCLSRNRVLFYNHATAGRIAYACVVLHNICMMHNVELPDEDNGNDPEDENDEPQPQNDINVLTEGRMVRRRLINELM